MYFSPFLHIFLLQICKMFFKVNKYFWWYSIVCLFGTRIYFQFKKQCVTNVFNRFSLVNLPTWCMTNLEVIEVCGPRVFWSRNTREYLTTYSRFSIYVTIFSGYSKMRFPGWPIFKLQHKRFSIPYNDNFDITIFLRDRYIEILL